MIKGAAMDHFNKTGFLEKPKADLALKNARVVNVFSGEIHETNVAIHNGAILGFGEYDARALIDLGGSYVCPGFIDGPFHIEQSLLLPSRVDQALVPFGTTTLIVDPEDILRVMGWDGIRFMIEASANLPFSVYFTLPSIIGDDLPERFMKNEDISGLFEFLKGGRSCFVHGQDDASLDSYYFEEDLGAAFKEEIINRLREGGHIRLSGDLSFDDVLRSLLPHINRYNSSRFMFGSGNLYLGTIMEQGRINNIMQKAVGLGLDPIKAVQMATINTARYFHLKGRGAIAPGYVADILVLNDLKNLVIDQVYKNGILVAEDSDLVGWEFPEKTPELRDAMNINWEMMDNIIIPAQGADIRVIGIIPDRHVTEEVIIKAPIEQNRIVCDPEKDIDKVVVLDRHFASGRMGKGLVKGFGLKDGAIASSFSFSSHNIVSVGAADEDIITAIEEVEKMRGGIAIVKKGVVLESLPLPFAGIMCDESPETVSRKMEDITAALRVCGSSLPNPVMSLSMLTCLKIPSLRITDEGLYDFHKSLYVELFVH